MSCCLALPTLSFNCSETGMQRPHEGSDWKCYENTITIDRYIYERFPPLPLPPRPPRPPFPPAASLPRAAPPRPLLANLTALRTFKTDSSGAGSRLDFLVSLSNFESRAKEALCSFDTGASVGSNYVRGQFQCVKFQGRARKLPSA